MNNNELKFFITCAIMVAVVLIILIGCVTYYNITLLKTEQISSGKPLSTTLYIHKLDDEQFAQLFDALKSKSEEQSK